MLYLITGGNGAGKTLNGLKWCKELADQTGRPVCYNGRFALREDGPLKNWKKIDAKDWQAEPDGTIFFFDECHNDFPIRGGRDAPPQYVAMLAEHRRRGFDFFLITQHPMNIDTFVRRLIQAPGYHRHLKRLAGASSMVSVLEWAAVNPQCEKPGSGDSGEVKTIAFPKEVYTWYDSAQLHTGKVRIPKAAYLVVVAALAVPLLGWYGFKQVTKDRTPTITGRPGATAQSPSSSDGAPRGSSVLSPQGYVDLRTARIEGFAHTAPVYDSLTTPKEAPYPAACLVRKVKGVQDCRCYTQQGTRLQMPDGMCIQIVENGFFIDWKSEDKAGAVGREPQAQQPGAVERAQPPTARAMPIDPGTVALTDGDPDALRPRF